MTLKEHSKHDVLLFVGVTLAELLVLGPDRLQFITSHFCSRHNKENIDTIKHTCTSSRSLRRMNESCAAVGKSGSFLGRFSCEETLGVAFNPLEGAKNKPGFVILMLCAKHGTAKSVLPMEGDNLEFCGRLRGYFTP